MNHPITGAVYPPHYLDAPGQHHPIDPNAPHPGNAATVAHLSAIMESRRNTHKVVHVPPMGLSPIQARENLIAFIRQEVA